MLRIELEPLFVDSAQRVPTAGALRQGGGAVAFPNGDVIAWSDARSATTVQVGFAAAAVCVTRNGRFLGATSAARDRLVVIDVERGTKPIVVDAPNARRQPLVAAFASTSTGTLALVSRRPGELELLDPASGATSSRSLATFRVTVLQPVARGRCAGPLGHFDWGDEDSFVVAAVDDVAASAEALEAQLRAKSGLAEYAYRIAVRGCRRGGVGRRRAHSRRPGRRANGRARPRRGELDGACARWQQRAGEDAAASARTIALAHDVTASSPSGQ